MKFIGKILLTVPLGMGEVRVTVEHDAEHVVRLPLQASNFHAGRPVQVELKLERKP